MNDASARGTGANPLAQLAGTVPPGVAAFASIVLRLAGAGAALYVAMDQSYDPTQALTIGIITVVVASLAPVAGSWRARLAAFGAGAIFFGGAVLLRQPAGALMLAAGGIAGCASMIQAYHRGERIDGAVAAFFVAAAAALGGIVTIIFTIDG
jgi:hypothetical protein